LFKYAGLKATLTGKSHNQATYQLEIF